MVMPFIVRTIRRPQQRSDLEAASAVLQMMVEVVRFNPCMYPEYTLESSQSIVKESAQLSKYKCI